MTTLNFYRTVLFVRDKLSSAEKRDVNDLDRIHKMILVSGFNHVPSTSDSTGSLRQKCGITYMVHREAKQDPRKTGRPVSIIIHSQEKPHWSNLPHYIDQDDVRVTSESIDLSEGSVIRFESIVSPVRQGQNEDGKRFKMPLVNRTDVGEWLESQLDRRSMKPVNDLFVRDEFTWNYVGKTNRAFPSRAVSGVVKICDSEEAKSLLLEGWGKNKAYGVGMVLAQNVEVNHA